MLSILKAHVFKELLLLVRDRAGLLILFLMPALLVLVLSLVQDNLYRATGMTRTKALYVNLDQGALGQTLYQRLDESGAIELVKDFKGRTLDIDTARAAVHEGDFQFAIVVPDDFSAAVHASAETVVRDAFKGKESPTAPVTLNKLTVYFDPTVRGVYRISVTSALERALFALEIEEKTGLIAKYLPRHLERELTKQLGALWSGGIGDSLPDFDGDWNRQRLIELNEEPASSSKYATLPTSVQQNVPAWTLFGMFFIVIPLAGTLIRERQEGTLQRLMTMPVGMASLLLGKVLAYLMVCMLQCALMLTVGKYVLPLLGTPVLELGNEPLALFAVALSAALAACGFGIMVGVLARSYEQASTGGAVAVVVAAAMGGIMVPVYVMPRIMQGISVISPLGWGLDAFLSIFVREGDVMAVLPQLASLWGFFLLCMAISSLVLHRRRKQGI